MSTLVLVGSQWGDEGKGKVTDVLAEHADVVVRYQGGANAGHTVVAGGRTYKLHLVPSGIVHGKTCVIGNGVVLDPEHFLNEVEYLRGCGLDVERIHVSDAAHVIFPYHKKLDELEEERRGEGRIGTTRRGIGPAYMDKVARAGIRVGDLLRPDTLRRKLEANLEQVNHLIEKVYGEGGFALDALLEQYSEFARRLAPFVTDTAVLINRAIDRGEHVLFEGAQGTMLDLDHGTYPYVTSSYPTAGGACLGSGVGPTRIDRVIGVAKAYTSRVGDGPFPTELRDATGDWIREKGHEYGTTTGRPRRCGWLDAVILRHSVLVSGLSGLALNHLDTLTGLHPLKIAVAYEVNGERRETLPRQLDELAEARPVYEELPGWDEPIGGVRTFDGLPAGARQYVERIEQLTGVPVVMISVGPSREQTFMRFEPFSAQRGR
ncbi:MAG: adenylosuccinate synthase [Clostridia bacterium]|nr:adenylosuccinate synthase [Clostridia bacterium]